jgi:hypothetical protein
VSGNQKLADVAERMGADPAYVKALRSDGWPFERVPCPASPCAVRLIPAMMTAHVNVFHPKVAEMLEMTK